MPPARPQSAVYATHGSLVSRPGPAGNPMLILVARQPHRAVPGAWIGGVVRLRTVAHQPNVIHLQDGRRVVVGALLSERDLDSWAAEMLVEAVVREAEIEHDVERMLADPKQATALFLAMAEYVPDQA